MNELARALLPIAHRAFSLPAAGPLEDEPVLTIALDTIDAFLAVPEASRYLGASRALRDLVRLRKRSTEIDRLARRSLDAELQRLSDLVPESSDHSVEILRALPADPRAGRRMQALVALLETHRALALRVRTPEQHRANLVRPDGGEPQAPTRRVSDRRGGAARVLRSKRRA